jgi:hypothetical protein
MQVVLDGSTFTLEFRWNTREQAWYLNVSDEAGVLIRGSVKVVVNWPLAARVVNPKKWPGRLVAQDTTGLQTNPGIADLGDRVALIYFEVADFANA